MLCLRKRQTSATSQPDDRNPKTKKKSKVNAFSLVRAVFKRPHLLKAAVLCVCAVAFIRKSLVVVRPSVRSSGRSVHSQVPVGSRIVDHDLPINVSFFPSFPNRFIIRNVLRVVKPLFILLLLLFLLSSAPFLSFFLSIIFRFPLLHHGLGNKNKTQETNKNLRGQL